MAQDTVAQRYGKLILLVGASMALTLVVASRLGPDLPIALDLVLFGVSLGVLAFFVSGVAFLRALAASFKAPPPRPTAE